MFFVSLLLFVNSYVVLDYGKLGTVFSGSWGICGFWFGTLNRCPGERYIFIQKLRLYYTALELDINIR